MPALPVRCRQIEPADISRIVTFRARGSAWQRASWLHAFKRLDEHSTPSGFPRYGYLLESGGAVVGVLLLIHSCVPDGDGRLRCSVSNWYVEPAFRTYASMLASHALKHRSVTYINATPSRHTWPILETQGYLRYCQGVMVSVPALSRQPGGCCVEAVTGDRAHDHNLPISELDLLRTHADYGCISVICHAKDGSYPFIFSPRRKATTLPLVHLVYCRDVADFVRFAGSVGRFLVRQGFPLALVDSNSPISGIAGRYVGNRPKYFKGPDPPRLGDLTYSEVAMFGP